MSFKTWRIKRKQRKAQEIFDRRDAIRERNAKLDAEFNGRYMGRTIERPKGGPIYRAESIKGYVDSWTTRLSFIDTHDATTHETLENIKLGIWRVK